MASAMCFFVDFSGIGNWGLQAPMSSEFGFHFIFHLVQTWCVYLFLVWVYLPFGCQFQVTITKYQVLQVCKKSKSKYFILKWNKHRQKVSLNMLYYQEMAQRAIEFSKLCKFDPFCSIPRARLAIFWKYDMFEDTFLDFSRLTY